MKYILLTSCFILCSCLSEKKNSSLSNSLSIASGSSSVLPSSTSIELEPSIHDCPSEDIAEYPVIGPKCRSAKLSVEELSFGKQGGVRCVTVSPIVGTMVTKESVSIRNIDYTKRTSNIEDSSDIRKYRERDVKLCYSESGNMFVSDTAGIFLGSRHSFKKLTCPWFTVTSVEAERHPPRTLHISVNQNETGNKREMYVSMRAITQYGEPGFIITQSAE
jgi:hypothetical protein